MKTTGVLMLVGMLTSLSASAGNALSPACAERVGTTRIEFSGQSFIAALETYYLDLDFEKDKKGFAFRSNWGVDVDETLDFENLTDTYSQYLMFSGVTALECHVSPDSCLQSMGGNFTLLQVAKRRMNRASADQVAAVNCALERLNLFSKAVRQTVLQQRQLQVHTDQDN